MVCAEPEIEKAGYYSDQPNCHLEQACMHLKAHNLTLSIQAFE